MLAACNKLATIGSFSRFSAVLPSLGLQPGPDSITRPLHDHLAHEEIAYKMLRSGATYFPEAANAAQLTGKIHMLIMVLFPLHHFELVQDMFF